MCGDSYTLATRRVERALDAVVDNPGCGLQLKSIYVALKDTGTVLRHLQDKDRRGT